MHLVTHRQLGSIARRPDAKMRRARPIRLLRQGWIELSDRLRTGQSVPDMKTFLTASLIALFAAVACTTEVPVTVEVEVTQEVEVTRLVEVTRHVEVTRKVEVTREVEDESVPRPRDLCLDYPYMLELGELQRRLYDSSLSAGQGATPFLSSLELDRATRDSLFYQLRTSRLNRSLICGSTPEPRGLADDPHYNSSDPLWAKIRRWEMKSFEGTGVCSMTLRTLGRVLDARVDMDDLPAKVRDAITAVTHGYVDFCDRNFLN